MSLHAWSFIRINVLVRTASSEQVRKPIYTGSLEQWRNFETELQPLKEALGDETIKRFEDYL